MAYIITVLKPVLSEHGAATSPNGQAYDLEPDLEKTVLALEEEEVASRLFNWRPGDQLTGTEATVVATITDLALEESMPLGEWTVRRDLPGGCEVKVERWGATTAVNWMVENGFDPVTQNFIDVFNNRSNA